MVNRGKKLGHPCELPQVEGDGEVWRCPTCFQLWVVKFYGYGGSQWTHAGLFKKWASRNVKI